MAWKCPQCQWINEVDAPLCCGCARYPERRPFYASRKAEVDDQNANNLRIPNLFESTGMARGNEQLERETAKRLVSNKHREAFSRHNRRQKCIQVLDKPGGVTIGVGSTALLAWKDAADAITRGEIAPSDAFPGASPTMSLASDEKFWKGRRHGGQAPETER